MFGFKKKESFSGQQTYIGVCKRVTTYDAVLHIHMNNETVLTKTYKHRFDYFNFDFVVQPNENSFRKTSDVMFEADDGRWYLYANIKYVEVTKIYWHVAYIPVFFSLWGWDTPAKLIQELKCECCNCKNCVDFRKTLE